MRSSRWLWIALGALGATVLGVVAVRPARAEVDGNNNVQVVVVNQLRPDGGTAVGQQQPYFPACGSASSYTLGSDGGTAFCYRVSAGSRFRVACGDAACVWRPSYRPDAGLAGLGDNPLPADGVEFADMTPDKVQIDGGYSVCVYQPTAGTTYTPVVTVCP